MSEANEVKRDGARATKNSGRGQMQKGDAILDGKITIDYKEYAETFGVSRSVWGKLCSDAIRNGHTIPALKIILGAGDSKLRLWVIGDDFFKEMWEAWNEKYPDL